MIRRDMETQRATARVHDVDARATVENICVCIVRARRLAHGVEPTARIYGRRTHVRTESFERRGKRVRARKSTYHAIRSVVVNDGTRRHTRFRRHRVSSAARCARTVENGRRGGARERRRDSVVCESTPRLARRAMTERDRNTAHVHDINAHVNMYSDHSYAVRRRSARTQALVVSHAASRVSRQRVVVLSP